MENPIKKSEHESSESWRRCALMLASSGHGEGPAWSSALSEFRRLSEQHSALEINPPPREEDFTPSA